MTDILINIVLDKSGSMASIRKETIKGFNDFIAAQKKLPGALVTLTTFNTESKLHYSARPIDKVANLSARSYIPDGGTALLDAVMKSIVLTESMPAIPKKVLFVIITDGLENSSREVKLEALKKRIKAKLADGWEFSYLAANVEDFAGEAASMGIPLASSAGYFPSVTSTRSTWGAITGSTTAMRSGGSYGATMSSLVDESGYVKEEEEEEEKEPTSATP